MIRLAIRLAVADIRSLPSRTATTSLLLLAAAWSPTLLDTAALVGIALASAVAFAATVGNQALNERRSILLARNGARASVHLVVSASSILAPAVVAWIVGLGTTLVPAAPGPLTVTSLTLAIPLLAALLAGWVMTRTTLTEQLEGTANSGWRRGVSIVTVVVLGVLVIPLGLLAAGLYLSSGSWSTDRIRRVISLALALVAIALVAVGVGASRTWTDLSFALIIALPILMVAVVIVGVHATAAVASTLSRTGSRARLALTPLMQRRRVLAPLVGLVVLVTTTAVTDSVVGASFGAREAAKAQTLPSVVVSAGNDARQVIVPVPPIDRKALDRIVTNELADTGATGVVIEQVGTGQPIAGALFGGLRGAYNSVAHRTYGDPAPSSETSSVWLAPGTDLRGRAADVGNGAAWLGVVPPVELGLLGWGDAAGPLADGTIVDLSGRIGWNGTPQTVVVGNRLEEHAVVALPGVRGGATLPGGLVSAATAAKLSRIRTTVRVVLVPTPGAKTTPSANELVALGRSIQRQTWPLPTTALGEPTATQRNDVETYSWLLGADSTNRTVRAGSDPVDTWTSGPLNDVPFFAGTLDQARRGVVGLISLPILITLAAVLLALGAGRRDDIIFRIQGASDWLRSSVAAIQAAVITTTASLIAATLGIGIPAVTFALYNRGADLPDIPLEVPGLVVAVLIVIPVVTTLLAAAVPLLQRRRNDDELTGLSDLAW